MESLPPTLAETVVDRLLARTEHLGAKLLDDPIADRAHLVGLAARAINSGLSASELWAITSVGLHNVHKQWALTARLADPAGFAKIRQVDFGGTPLGGPTPSVCEFHPTAVADAQGGCAECSEIERQAALARGETVEFTCGQDGLWRDHTGRVLSETEEWEGMSQAQITEEMAVREKMRRALVPDSAAHAQKAREALRRLRRPDSDEEAAPGVPGAAGGS
ncbi:hypothetical protein [Nocardiopsis sp. JB363]|uniref:hypothetical protein n=1 Tax=Nocardiopsis sp. JB363 TaxID=1434837 RepID=UPI00097B9B67|nr:hypothetical protein [Nocardiopsis sp. JB363]SIO86144.1 hypothetical protein BQ8420_10515 [Nocardiopsis sp. JB363]